MKKYIILFLLSFFVYSTYVYAYSEYGLSLSVSTQYTDNLYLTSSDKVDDWLSLFGFIFNANNMTKLRSLQFSYNFERAQYWRFPDNNTNRHFLNFSYSRRLSRKLGFNISSSYNFSEESIERNQDVFRERIGRRETYYRLNVGSNIDYNFARNSVLSIGSSINYLQNKDPNIEDARIYNEFMRITKGFSKYSFGVSFQSTQREMERTPQVNTWSYALTGSYNVAYNKSLSLSFSAERTQNYAPGINDYWVYNMQLNYSYQYSKDQQIGFSFGYYERKMDASKGGNSNGFSYSLNYVKQFRHSVFSVSGNGGYRYEYGESYNPGFTKYYLINMSISREITRTFSGSLSSMYRHEDFTDENSMADTYQFSAHLQKTLLKDLYLSTEYSYRKQSPSGHSFVPGYEENTIFLVLRYNVWRGRSLW